MVRLPISQHGDTMQQKTFLNSSMLLKKKIAVLMILLFLLTPFTISSSIHSTKFQVSELNSTQHRIDRKISELQGDTIVLFKTMEIAKKVNLQLNGKSILFEPLPIIYINDMLKSSEKGVLQKYDKYIVYIGPNHHYKLPSFKLAKSHNNDTLKPTTVETLNTINATPLHNAGIKGDGVRIAIIDTGIWADHPDLKGRVIAQQSFIKRIYGYPVDSSDTSDTIGHGTLVAGVAAGNGKQNSEYIGVAPNAYIINAKVFYGDENNYVATDAGIIAAITWCVNEVHANVINLSLGGPAQLSDPLLIAIEWAVKKGTIFTVAAGNEGDNGRGTMQISTPGVSKFVITAGATDAGGNGIESYSSLGPIMDMSIKPDVVAPGYVTAPAAKDVLGGYYETVRGTSFAAPHLAGSVALLLQVLRQNNVSFSNGVYYTALIKTVLMNTSRSLGAPDPAEGAGLINVGKAWSLLKDIKSNSPLPLITSILPKKLPAGYSFPWKEKLFLGMRLEFNFTLYSTVNTSVNLEVSGNISSIFKPISVNATAPHQNIPIILSIPENLSLGYYSGNITFRAGGSVIYIVPVHFQLAAPRGFILFDLRHTSWLIDSKYGQFRHYYELAESLDFGVEQIYWNSPPLTFDMLKKYDLIFMPDTASYYQIYFENGTQGDLGSKYITPSEIDALERYVQNGGSIIFVAMFPIEEDSGNNLTNINEFASKFGVLYSDQIIEQSDPISSVVLENPYFDVGGEYLPFVGGYMNIIDKGVSDSLIEVAMFGKRYTVGAIHVDSSGGFVLLTSTNFFFDNWSFEGAYHTTSNEAYYTRRFHTAVLDNIGYRKNILINPLNANVTFGQRVYVNITIVDLNYTNLEVYYRDRIGIVRLTDLQQIGPNSYRVSFVPRHARDVAVIAKVTLSNARNVSRAQVIYIEPSETVTPELNGFSPQNNSKITMDIYEVDYFTVVLNFSDNFEALPNVTDVYCILETKFTRASLPVTVNWMITTDKRTATVKLMVDKEVIINNVLLASSVKLVFYVKLYDVNLNTLSITLSYTLTQEGTSTVLIASALIFFILVLVLMVAIIRKFRKVSKTETNIFYKW